jgi:transposase-like protein
MAKRVRKSYTEAQRQQILGAAQAEKLTAVQVQKRFGVTPVTYYSWRKKSGIKGPRGRRPGAASAAGGGALAVQVRAGVQAKVRELVPNIVREEVSSYLNALFGGAAPRRRGRPRKKK